MSKTWQPNRRQFIKATAATSAMVQYPLLAQQKPAAPSLEQYQPIFFNAEEWQFLLAACDRLIPSGAEGPGALETHVPIFIDLQLNGDFGQAADWYMAGPHEPDADPTRGFQSPLTPAQIYQQAIHVINDWCQKNHQSSFAQLDAKTQDNILNALQKNQFPLEPELKDFFTFLLQNTKEGYFADPMYGGNFGMAAWVYIGFPGARASFTEWVDQQNVPYPLGPVSISGQRA